jgi:serine kinase of HPr protein (carbohydrate metabolism regulator)
MSSNQSTIHASVVLVGARAVLIRGPSAAGKSRLALVLLQAAQTGLLGFARLVADDRVLIESAGGRLLAQPAPALAGLIEVHGLGVRRVPHEPVAVVGTVLDLAAADGSRLPEQASRQAEISGVRLPRLAVAAGVEPLPLLLAYLQTADAISCP